MFLPWPLRQGSMLACVPGTLLPYLSLGCGTSSLRLPPPGRRFPGLTAGGSASTGSLCPRLPSEQAPPQGPLPPFRSCGETFSTLPWEAAGLSSGK